MFKHSINPFCIFFLTVSLVLPSFNWTLAAGGHEPSLHLRQFVGLVEYIRGDYPAAVKDGQVISASEWQEMKDFAASAKRQLAEVEAQISAEQRHSLASKLEQLSELIDGKASYEAILAITGGLKQEAIVAFKLPVGPDSKPDWQLGQKVYGQACASCHGPSGRGDGWAGVSLDPLPRDFHDPEAMALSSPFKFYNILVTGIEGTGMASYKDVFSPAELWSVSFYVSGLRHLEENSSQGFHPEDLWRQLAPEVRSPLYKAGLTVAMLASMTDDELQALSVEKLATPLEVDPDAQGGEGKQGAQEWLSRLRTLVPYLGSLPLDLESQEERRGQRAQAELIREGIDYALQQIHRAHERFNAGARGEAESYLLDAYLYGFEKTEAALTVIDPSITSQVERLFMDARGYARQGQSEAFAKSMAALELAVKQAKERYDAHTEDGAGSFWGEFISSFVIIVREGFEAFLVIAALLALLTNMGQAQARWWVHAGWLLALVAGGLTYVVFHWVLKLSGFAKESLEAICTGIAVVLLFYTGFWLLSQSERYKWDRFIKTKTKLALSSGRLWSLFFMAFIAVYREAAETVLFYAALFSTAKAPWMITGGFVAGCLVLAGLCGGIIRFNLKLPLRQFFLVTSCLMVAISVVLAGKTVHELVEAGLLHATPLAGVPAIDLLGIYPSLETLSVQGLLLGLGLVLAYILLRKKKSVNTAL